MASKNIFKIINDSNLLNFGKNHFELQNLNLYRANIKNFAVEKIEDVLTSTSADIVSYSALIHKSMDEKSVNEAKDIITKIINIFDVCSVLDIESFISRDPIVKYYMHNILYNKSDAELCKLIIHFYDNYFSHLKYRKETSLRGAAEVFLIILQKINHIFPYTHRIISQGSKKIKIPDIASNDISVAVKEYLLFCDIIDCCYNINVFKLIISSDVVGLSEGYRDFLTKYGYVNELLIIRQNQSNLYCDKSYSLETTEALLTLKNRLFLAKRALKLSGGVIESDIDNNKVLIPGFTDVLSKDIFKISYHPRDDYAIKHSVDSLLFYKTTERVNIIKLITEHLKSNDRQQQQQKSIKLVFGDDVFYNANNTIEMKLLVAKYFDFKFVSFSFDSSLNNDCVKLVVA